MILSYPDITGVHDLVLHDYGPGRMMGSAHVEVSRTLDVMQAHDMIDNAEKACPGGAAHAFCPAL